MKHHHTYLPQGKSRSFNRDLFWAALLGVVAVIHNPAAAANPGLAGIATILGFLAFSALHDIRAALYRLELLSPQEETPS